MRTGRFERLLDAAVRERRRRRSTHGKPGLWAPCFARGAALSRGRSGSRARARSAVHRADRRARAGRERTGSRAPSTTHRRGADRPSSESTPRTSPTSSSRASSSATSEALSRERSRPSAGLLEVAGDGTAYLDEVSSLSPAAQAKFLRVLQEKTFRRLGGVTSHQFRARLVVSSRRDLPRSSRRGVPPRLFYRIDVVSIRLPPLYERPEDILPLARTFLKRAARA